MPLGQFAVGAVDDADLVSGQRVAARDDLQRRAVATIVGRGGLRDLFPIGFLCGIGFTVSLLITELSFEDGTHFRAAKVGILAASFLAAVLGAVLLRWDARTARLADMNRDDLADQDHGVIGDPDDH